MARLASSFPGTGKAMPCGLTFESRMATTGIPSTFASLIASSSLLASITKMTSGRPPMSRMPPSESSNLSRSRVSCSTSFLVRPAVSPESCSSRLLKRLIEPEIVFQLVSMPPSQRWLTKCWPERRAPSRVRPRRRACGAGRFRDRILRLALGADEQRLAARGDALADEVERAREERHGLRQVDDVDAVPLAENIRLHLRVPAVGLVAEMRAGLEQLLHADVG